MISHGGTSLPVFSITPDQVPFARWFWCGGGKSGRLGFRDWTDDPPREGRACGLHGGADCRERGFAARQALYLLDLSIDSPIPPAHQTAGGGARPLAEPGCVMYLNLVQIAESFGASERVAEGWLRDEGMPRNQGKAGRLSGHTKVVAKGSGHSMATRRATGDKSYHTTAFSGQRKSAEFLTEVKR